KLTFSMLYFYSERYILALSHDENVHGKATIIQKMYGDYDDKFPQARALYMYMYAHPGKKLNFMGSELAQFREWDEKREQDWDILKYPLHDGFNHFMKKLCKLYLSTPALSRWDDSYEGFRWLDCDSALKRCYTIQRSCPGEAPIVCVMNFSDRLQEDYVLTIGAGKRLRLLLDSTEDRYGGCAPHYPGSMTADKHGCVKLSVPRYSAAYYELVDAPVKHTDKK
ncbi:MAG: alpha amylase C-terminal domain-containing protein, partial [Oscillospiraceae bacterium]